MAHQHFPVPKARPRTELEGSLDRALDDRVRAVIEKGKGGLEVNRPKRKIPFYPFVPSHHHPDPV